MPTWIGEGLFQQETTEATEGMLSVSSVSSCSLILRSLGVPRLMAAKGAGVDLTTSHFRRRRLSCRLAAAEVMNLADCGSLRALLDLQLRHRDAKGLGGPKLPPRPMIRGSMQSRAEVLPGGNWPCYRWLDVQMQSVREGVRGPGCTLRPDAALLPKADTVSLSPQGASRAQIGRK